MGLTRQLLGVPTTGDALETFALGDSNAVDHFVLLEHLADWDLTLEVLTRPIDLLGNSTTIDLDLHDVSLLVAVLQDLDLKILAEISIIPLSKVTNLSVSDDTNRGAVLLDLVQILLDRFLAILISPLLGVLRKTLLFRVIPRMDND